jgi:hypothetical protein
MTGRRGGPTLAPTSRRNGSSSEAGRRASGLILLILFCLLAAQAGAAEKAGEKSDVSGTALSAPDAAGRVEHPRPPLSAATDSIERLARRFLETLAEGDRRKIKAMALTHDEFVARIYPGLPASRPGSNLSAEFLWRQTLLRNLAGLQKTMGYAGRRLQFVSIRLADGLQEYDGFRMHRDVRLTVRDSDGKEFEVKLFGSILEAGGKFKIYSFAH